MEFESRKRRQAPILTELDVNIVKSKLNRENISHTLIYRRNYVSNVYKVTCAYVFIAILVGDPGIKRKKSLKIPRGNQNP